MKRSGRKAVASALATAALALTLLPGAAFADIGVDLGPLNIQRDCGYASGGADAQAQCSYNIAQPSATQDASAVAVNKNEAATVGLNLQKQVNVLEPDASIENHAMVGNVSPEAKLIVESGDVAVRGHDAYVDMSGLRQSADAGAEGFVFVTNETGAVGNASVGSNWAIANAGAANNTNAGLLGGAFTSADDATLGGDGGNGTGNEAGDAASASHFGLDGGWGGSNVNLGLGASVAAGGNGGPAGSSASQSISPYFAFLAVNGEAESGATGGSGYAASGFGAQANPAQNAGAGAPAWFTLAGNGGAASGDNNANGGAGSISNSSTISGSSTANGWAQGGTVGNTSAGNTQLGQSGNNSTTVAMTGGVAINTLDFGLYQSGAVTGYSGGVTNRGSVSASSPVSISQGGTPTISMTNTPAQSAYNTGATTQSASSAGQTVSPAQTVGTGTQSAMNGGIQDALKARDSFNHTQNTTITDNSRDLDISTGCISVAVCGG